MRKHKAPTSTPDLGGGGGTDQSKWGDETVTARLNGTTQIMRNPEPKKHRI
jgi:hypothetical protein